MHITTETLNWLQEAPAGYIRFEAAGLLAKETLPRRLLLQDPFIRDNLQKLKGWDEEVLTRHDKADLLLHRLALVADLGVRAEDPGMATLIRRICHLFTPEGIPQIRIRIPKAFGGTDEVTAAWMLCDFPLLLYSLQKMGAAKEFSQPGLQALEALIGEEGYQCRSSVPKFKGPGPRSSICPYANLLAARALGVGGKSPAAGLKACAALLHHWQLRHEKKFFLFGIGTDFKKLKFPLVWYNLLHVVEALSHYPAVHHEPGFREMWELLVSKADSQGRFTPESMYRAYSQQDFANKKAPSPLLSLQVYRIARRLGEWEVVA